MAPPARKRLSYADYLELERQTDWRHEFLDGEAWAMAGGTPRHSRIKMNLAGLVWSKLGDGPCQPYDSDLKIRVLETGLATYPDLSIMCGELERDPEDRNAVTNPAVLFEVLSPSTERWDRGGKFHHVQRIPSLRHYVLEDKDRPLVEVFSRAPDGGWSYQRLESGQTAQLEHVGLELDVDRLYRNLPATEDEPEDEQPTPPPPVDGRS